MHDVIVGVQTGRSSRAAFLHRRDEQAVRLLAGFERASRFPQIHSPRSRKLAVVIELLLHHLLRRQPALLFLIAARCRCSDLAAANPRRSAHRAQRPMASKRWVKSLRCQAPRARRRPAGSVPGSWDRRRSNSRPRPMLPRTSRFQKRWYRWTVRMRARWRTEPAASRRAMRRKRDARTTC